MNQVNQTQKNTVSCATNHLL